MTDGPISRMNDRTYVVLSKRSPRVPLRRILSASTVQRRAPVKLLRHTPLHLVNLLQLEHLLPYDAPRFVRARVVTNDLQSDRMKTEMNKRWPDDSRVGNQAVKGRRLQRRGVNFCAMEGVRD
jgi:hypothetical protein